MDTPTQPKHGAPTGAVTNIEEELDRKAAEVITFHPLFRYSSDSAESREQTSKGILLKHPLARFSSMKRGEVNAIIGEAGGGKSSWSFMFGAHLAVGRKFCGIPAPVAPLRVAYVDASCENDWETMQGLVDSAREIFKNDAVALDRLNENLVPVLSGPDHVGIDFGTGPESVRQFEAVLQKAWNEGRPLDSMLIDNAHAVIPDMNDQREMNSFLRGPGGLMAVAKRFGVCIWLQHHPTKPTTVKGSASRMAQIEARGAYSGSGSAVLANSARIVIAIAPHDDDPNTLAIFWQKQQNRSWWRDRNTGVPIVKHYVRKVDPTGNMIAFRDLEKEERDALEGAGKKVELRAAIVHFIREMGRCRYGDVVDCLAAKYSGTRGMGRDAIRRAVVGVIDGGAESVDGIYARRFGNLTVLAAEPIPNDLTRRTAQEWIDSRPADAAPSVEVEAEQTVMPSLN